MQQVVNMNKTSLNEVCEGINQLHVAQESTFQQIEPTASTTGTSYLGTDPMVPTAATASSVRSDRPKLDDQLDDLTRDVQQRVIALKKRLLLAPAPDICVKRLQLPAHMRKRLSSRFFKRQRLLLLRSLQINAEKVEGVYPFDVSMKNASYKGFESTAGSSSLHE